MIRKGTVSAVNHQAETCRVKTGDLETDWIRWLAFAAGTTRDWNPPTVGENVLLLCPGGDPASGVALCGIYAGNAPAPSHSPDTHTRAYPDGAVIEYDHAKHSLLATLPEGGAVRLTAPASVNVTTPLFTLDGNGKVTGNVDVDDNVGVAGNVTAKGQGKFASAIIGNGASGTFATASKQTVTVRSGIVTSIVQN